MYVNNNIRKKVKKIHFQSSIVLRTLEMMRPRCWLSKIHSSRCHCCRRCLPKIFWWAAARTADRATRRTAYPCPKTRSATY